MLTRHPRQHNKIISKFYPLNPSSTPHAYLFKKINLENFLYIYNHFKKIRNKTALSHNVKEPRSHKCIEAKLFHFLWLWEERMYLATSTAHSFSSSPKNLPFLSFYKQKNSSFPRVLRTPIYQQSIQQSTFRNVDSKRVLLCSTTKRKAKILKTR